jgi:diamine N-acetyltransferase
VLEDTEGNAVGCVDLFDYDAIDRRAAIGIIIEKKYRVKGYAAEAITLMKDYAFNRIGMRQLHCSVGVSNEKSIQLFRSAGFTEIGIRKDWSFRNGAFHDVVEFQFINK